MLESSHAGVIELGHALRAGWIEFAYQPKIELRRRCVVGVEMLARARHPFHGLLGGNAILAGADDASLLQLAVFALRYALQASGALARESVNVPITVNVPASVLDVESLKSALGAASKAPRAPTLILDVPKHALLHDHARFARMVPDLRALGISLAAEDFCGNLRRMMRSTNPEALHDEMDALSQQLKKLTRLSLAELKLDRELVAGCAEDKTRAMLCELLIDLIHQLGAKAVAVGVERHADVALLQAMDCDIAQGYAFCEPASLDELLAQLKGRRHGAGVRMKASAVLAR